METAPTATSPPSMPNHNHSTPDPGNGETWTQILEQLHREISQALTGALPISPKPFHTLSLEELKNLLVTLRFERNINTAQLTGEQRRSLLLRLKICSVWGLSFQAFSDTFGNTVSRDLLDKLLALARQYSFATARPYLLHERQRRRSHTGARRLVEADWLPSDVARAEASLQQAAQAAPQNDVDISAGDELSNLSSGSFFALTINDADRSLIGTSSAQPLQTNTEHGRGTRPATPFQSEISPHFSPVDPALLNPVSRDEKLSALSKGKAVSLPPEGNAALLPLPRLASAAPEKTLTNSGGQLSHGPSLRPKRGYSPNINSGHSKRLKWQQDLGEPSPPPLASTPRPAFESPHLERDAVTARDWPPSALLDRFLAGPKPPSTNQSSLESPDGWIDTAVIHACLRFTVLALPQQLATMDPVVSLLSPARPFNLRPTTKSILVPYCVEGVHWALAHALLKEREMRLYDELPASVSASVPWRKLGDQMVTFLDGVHPPAPGTGKWNIVEAIRPKPQPDGLKAADDSKIDTIANAWYIAFGMPKPKHHDKEVWRGVIRGILWPDLHKSNSERSVTSTVLQDNLLRPIHVPFTSPPAFPRGPATERAMSTSDFLHNMAFLEQHFNSQRETARAIAVSHEPPIRQATECITHVLELLEQMRSAYDATAGELGKGEEEIDKLRGVKVVVKEVQPANRSLVDEVDRAIKECVKRREGLVIPWGLGVPVPGETVMMSQAEMQVLVKECATRLRSIVSELRIGLKMLEERMSEVQKLKDWAI